MAGTKRQAFLSRSVAPTVLMFVFGLAVVGGAWAASLECPEDLCTCFPNASQFAVVGGKVTGRPGGDLNDEGGGAFIFGSMGGLTAKLSARPGGELDIAGDAILTSGVGTRAVRFKGYKLDGLPTPGIFIDRVVVLGGNR